MMKRREFLIGSALAAGAGTMLRRSVPDQAKLDRMVVMSLSFGRMLKSPAHPDDPNRTLDILDLPDMVAQRWGIHHVEMQHSHFPSTETGYLEELHNRLKKAKSQVNQINLEFGQLNISSPNPSLRVETIDLTKEWIDHAVAIGCPRVMVNQGTLAPEVRQTAIDTLKTINAYGKARKVFVTMENRDDGPDTGRGGRAGAVPPGTVPPGATEAAMRCPSALSHLGGGSGSDQGFRNLPCSLRSLLRRLSAAPPNWACTAASTTATAVSKSI